MLVIVNPAAGRGRAAGVWRRTLARLGGLPPGVECSATEAAGHARTLARAAVGTGVERVVVVGGDGTVSEVADGLADTEVALGIIPAGTGNDFSWALRLPKRPELAARRAFEGTPRRIDRGWVRIGDRRRAFVNVAGCGFDAEVVRRTQSTAQAGGFITYLIGIMHTLRGFQPRPLRMTVDGQTLERRALGVAVANGPRYGGGMRIAPRAVLDDGLLEVCVVGDVTPAQLLALLPRLYLGTHARHWAVETFTCRDVTIGAGELECQADGELLGCVPAHFGIEPRGLLCVT